MDWRTGERVNGRRDRRTKRTKRTGGRTDTWIGDLAERGSDLGEEHDEVFVFGDAEFLAEPGAGYGDTVQRLVGDG